MPLYDVRCSDCQEEFETVCRIAELKDLRCHKCKGKVEVLITSHKSRDWFREGYYEDLDIHPVYVKSQKHLKELCLKYDVTSRALGDVRSIREI